MAKDKKKNKKIAKEDKKNSLIDRLRFMQKDAPPESKNSHLNHQTHNQPIFDSSELPPFFKMVQEASKGVIEQAASQRL